MKKLIRNASIVALGLLLGALPMAGSWNVDIHAGYVYGFWVPYATTTTGVSAPSGSVVSWYAYTYGGSGSYATASASGPGVSVGGTVYDNANNGSHGTMTSAGYVSVFLETGASGGGGTGCGVTVSW